MASGVTSCSSCVFGAVSPTTLSFPYSFVSTVNIQVHPSISVFANGSSATIGQNTVTGLPDIISTVEVPGGTPTVTFTQPDELTWSTFGTVLSYPTVYVGYTDFEGATATPSGCAESVTPTSLTLPTDVISASLVYPNSDASAGLPSGLLSYLNSLGSFTSQLGEAITACATPGGVAAPSSTPSATSSPITSTVTESNLTTTVTLSTSFTTETSTLTTSTTIQTTTSAILPTTSTIVAPFESAPPTTVTSPTSVITTSLAVATTQTSTLTPAVYFSINTVPVIIQSGSTTTLSSPTALAASVQTSASVNSVAISEIFGLLGSSSAAAAATTTAPYGFSNGTSATPYTIVTASSSTYALLNGTSTTYTVPYTGAAKKFGVPANLGWVECLFGLALPALL